VAKIYAPMIPASITNRAHRGAFRRGWNAYCLGSSQTQCPYHVQAEDRYGNSYRRVFARCWCEGWSAAARYDHLHQVGGWPTRRPG